MPSSESPSSSHSESSAATTKNTNVANKPVAKNSKAKSPKSNSTQPDFDSDSSSSSSHSDSESEDEDREDEDMDAHVLSHAERRRQKKKQQKDTELIAAPTASTAKVVKNTAELVSSKLPKRQNSIWVGNLSFKTTAESLRKFFEGCGEITRVHMPLKMASGGPGVRGTVKENRGFAYVDFATPDQKTVAVALSENHLDGRRLLIKDGTDFNGRPSTSTAVSGEDGGADNKSNSITATKTAQKILRAQKQPAGPTLFFGNLGFETTEQSLRDLLIRNRKRSSKVAGEDDEDEKTKSIKEKWIRKIRMGTFEDTGKCKGWAFIDFHRHEDATESLVNVRCHRLDGRNLVVEYASPDAVRRGGARVDGSGAKSKNRDESGPRDTNLKRKAEGERGDEGEDIAMGVDETVERATIKRRKTGEDDGAPRTRRYSKDGKPPRARPKPGAALALAKRETATIVPSQGKKIVF